MAYADLENTGIVCNLLEWLMPGLPIDRGRIERMQGENIQADVQAAKDAEHVANLKTEQETLAKNWGIHAPANKVIAQNAALALGMTKEDVDALETVVGYARTMELLRNIGTKIGEAKFIRPDGPGGQNIVSREQATARIKELQSDAVWRKAYLDGDKAKLREMTDLTKISVGDDIEGRF